MAQITDAERNALRDQVRSELGNLVDIGTPDDSSKVDLLSGLVDSLIVGQTVQAALFKINIPNIFKAAYDFINGIFGDIYKTVTDFIINGLLGADVLPEEFKSRVRRQFEAMGVLGPVISIVLGLGMSLEAVKQMINLAGTFVERDFNLTFRMKEMDPRSLIRSVYVNPSTFPIVKKRLQETGYLDSDILLMLRAEHSPLPLEVIRILAVQSAITPEQAKAFLHENGYTDARIQQILTSWKHVLSSGELLQIVSKGGTSDALNQALGLDAGYPSNWDELMSKNGYSAEDAQAIYRTHWILPDLRSALIMRERGMISDTTYRLILGYSGVVPSQIDNVTEVNYTLIPFRALAQMHGEGIIDDDALMKEIVSHGFGDDRSKIIFTWIKESVSGSKQAATEARILQAYNMHALSRADAKASLVSIHYSDSDAEWLLDDEDAKQQIIEKKEREAIVRESYEGRLIEEDEARSELTALDYAPSFVDTLIARWTVRRTLTIALPSKSDLDHFRTTGIIDDATYIAYMEKLRYPPEVISWYMALPATKTAARAKLTARKESQALVQKSTEVSYKAATIDEATAKAQLVNAGITDALATTLLLDWTPARSATLAKQGPTATG